jgi:hypothetical protein
MCYLHDNNTHIPYLLVLASSLLIFVPLSKYYNIDYTCIIVILQIDYKLVALYVIKHYQWWVVFYFSYVPYGFQ